MTAVLDEATFVPAPLLDAEPLPAFVLPAAKPNRVGAALQGAVLAVALAVTALAVVPALLGYHGQVVLSGSMAPRLHVGDVTYLKAAPASSLHVGQVVTFPVTQDGRTVHVTHRIVAMKGSGDSALLTTRGDANPVNDSFTTTASKVTGVYAFSVPRLGKALQVLRSQTGYFLVAGLVFLLVLLHEGRILIGEWRGWQARRRLPALVRP